MPGFGRTTCLIATGLPWTTVLGSIGRFAGRCFWSMAERGLRRSPVRNLQLVFKAFFEKQPRGRRHDLRQQKIEGYPTRPNRVICSESEITPIHHPGSGKLNPVQRTSYPS